MAQFNPIEDEIKLTKRLFDLNEVLEFTSEHRVEVVIQSDMQYHCFIDYKEGDGTYASGLTPLFTLWKGIEAYRKNSLK